MGAVTMVMLCETACATGHHHRSLPSRDEAPSGNDTDFSNRIELANNNLGANGSTSYPTRGQVLQACSITSGLLLALGATIRQAAHVASVEGWAVLDSSEILSSLEPLDYILVAFLPGISECAVFEMLVRVDHIVH
ncbi:CAAX protease self-immunity [Musa troglodytarum]|nr:CAAX protease self-immunity [Musa troglodytarum]